MDNTNFSFRKKQKNDLKTFRFVKNKKWLEIRHIWRTKYLILYSKIKSNE